MKKPTKKRPGRHRLPADKRRTAVLTLKLNKGERDLVWRAAQADEVAPYAWGRRALVQTAKSKLGTDTEK